MVKTYSIGYLLVRRVRIGQNRETGDKEERVFASEESEK